MATDRQHGFMFSPTQWAAILLIGVIEWGISRFADGIVDGVVKNDLVRDIVVAAIIIIALIVGLVVLLGVLAAPAGSKATRRGQRQNAQPSPVTFHAETVRVSLSQVHISGLLAKRPSNESVSFLFNVANFSGLPIRVKGVRGHIAIGDERQEPPPNLVLPGGEPIEVPFQTTRPADLRQVTAGLRDQLFESGMYAKNSVTTFVLSNIKLLCDVVMPDGSEKEQELRISDSSFLLRGPLREDEDYEAVNRQSLSFGSNHYYGADGPNDTWYQIP